MKLKDHPLEHRIWWVKHDLKRAGILFVIPILFALLFPVYGFSFLGLRAVPTQQQHIYIWIFSFVFCFVVQLLSSHKPDYKQDVRAALFFSPYLFFVNAFVEELFFRGFLLSLLLQLFGSPVLAIFVSSVIFGYYHIPMFGWTWQKALLAFFGGLYFGTIFVVTKSLFVVWIAHGLGDIGLIHESIVGFFVWTKIRQKELL